MAAAAFTIQLAVEEEGCDATKMRALERQLFASLTAPWELAAFSPKIANAIGQTWEELAGNNSTLDT